MSKFLENLQKYIIYLVVFMLPLVATSIFANAFFISKIALLAFGVALALLLWAISFGLTGKASWGTGRFDFALILLAGSYLASAFIRTPNKMEAFLLPGSATLLTGGAILYFLINQLGKEGQKKLTELIFYSGVTFSLISLLSITGILAKIGNLPDFVKVEGFNTLGGYLPGAIFLATIAVLGIGILIKEKETVKKLFHSVSLAIVFLALFITVNASLPGKPQSPRLSSFSTSWNVAVDTIQARPLWGIGPGNYLTAFNRFRPLSYNQTDLWSLRFTSARNFYLTIITEGGLIATFTLILLVLAVYKLLKEKLDLQKLNLKSTKLYSLLLLLVLVGIFPATPYLTVLIFILLALNSDAKLKIIDLSAGNSSKIPALIVSLPLITALAVFGYYGSRALNAEAKFKTALDFVSKNDGKATYDTLREAIDLSPRVDRYRATYSQVNLALARNIAQSAPEGGLTDSERQTVATLIQQAIREARASVTLNQTRSGNWEVMARTYQAILAFAQGADGFAAQSYTQAIALDPTNPNLRISLGGLYYALGNYDEAINIFKLAVTAKPDLANAHYNLAVTYREKGDIDSAITQMTNVLALVLKDSSDFKLATEVMDALKARKEAEAGNTENLTTPTEQEVLVRPPLSLPEDSAPPATTSSQSQ